MKYQDYLLKATGLIICAVIFKQYIAPYVVPDEKYLVHKFIYNNDYSTSKPYLWLYIETEKNARTWTSFNDRMSSKMNIPFVEHCLKSIIQKNQELFNVCLVTDDDMRELIPDWNYNISELSEPTKTRVQRLAKLQLLYYYGGLLVPSGCLCKSGLRSLYAEARNGPFVIPCDKNNRVIGSRKGENNLLHHIENMKSYVHDQSNEPEFNDLMNSSASNNLRVLDEGIFGVCDEKNVRVGLRELLGEKEIIFKDNMVSIFIPKEEIVDSSKYGWFARMTNEDIRDSNLWLRHVWFDGKNIL